MGCFIKCQCQLKNAISKSVFAIVFVYVFYKNYNFVLTMEKYDTSQLTEFPRFESESSQGGVTTFLNKLWKFPIFTPSETADNQDNKAQSDVKADEQPIQQHTEEKDYEDKLETVSYVEECEGRSLPNIVKRISGLVALGSGVCFQIYLKVIKSFWHNFFMWVAHIFLNRESDGEPQYIKHTLRTQNNVKD